MLYSLPLYLKLLALLSRAALTAAIHGEADFFIPLFMADFIFIADFIVDMAMVVERFVFCKNAKKKGDRDFLVGAMNNKEKEKYAWSV